MGHTNVLPLAIFLKQKFVRLGCKKRRGGAVSIGRANPSQDFSVVVNRYEGGILIRMHSGRRGGSHSIKLRSGRRTRRRWHFGRRRKLEVGLHGVTMTLFLERPNAVMFLMLDGIV
jgi:hypothetical protein